MSRMIGTVSMGIRAPIIREGDNLVEIVANCILEAMKEQSIPAFKRNGLIFQTAEKSITKPVNNKDIINKLTEIIPERVEEAKNIISQTRSVTTETVLKIKEEK